MMYSNRVCERLHDEHMATLGLLEKLEHFVGNNNPPEAGDTAARTLLIDLAVAFENEIWRHFAFEEKHLFDYFAQSGDTEMAQHLTTEHEQIRNVGGAHHRAGARRGGIRIFAGGLERVPPACPATRRAINGARAQGGGCSCPAPAGQHGRAIPKNSSIRPMS